MRNNHWLCILLLVMLTISIKGNGQQTSLYTQYMFNGLVINPAYAGSHDALSITAFGRKQWSSVDGAPTTATLSAHTPIKKQKMGVGLIVSNDNVTIFNQSTLGLIYSYQIHFTNKRKLSFGLQAGVSNYNARYSDLTSKTPNDPGRASTDVNSWNPNFGAGVYYYSQKFYVGLSVPYLASNIMKSRIVANHLELRNNYFFTTGYVMKISSDFKFKPNVLVKYVAGNPVQVDLNANFLFKEVLWTGLSLRSTNAVSFLMQLNISEQLRIGYSYDLSIGPLAGFGSGAHEFMINYFFSFTKTKVDSPRYF